MHSATLFGGTLDDCRPAVFDASSIIEIKQLPKKDQWDILKRLEVSVENGAIVVPKEVMREVKEYAHPDGPGIWMYGVERKMKWPVEPDSTVLQNVLTQCPGLVDNPDQPIDGDPFVVALALQLRGDGHPACVVTEDVNDRPPGMSIATACRHFQIPYLRLRQYLA